jgi:antitoxin ParD1/3/4
VADLVDTGYYQSQSEVLRQGLRLLKEREDLKKMRLSDLRQAIAAGARQADRGEFVDGPKRSPASAAAEPIAGPPLADD